MITADEYPDYQKSYKSIRRNYLKQKLATDSKKKTLGCGDWERSEDYKKTRRTKKRI